MDAGDNEADVTVINQGEANCRSMCFNNHEEEWTEILHCTTLHWNLIPKNS